MSDAVMLAIIGCIQALGTGIVSVLVKRNACGGSRCKQAIKDAFSSLEANQLREVEK